MSLQRKPRNTDEFNVSLLESYKHRRMAIANMPELPPSPPPPQSHLTSSELEDARTQRVGHLRGRAVQAFEAAKGNPADGRWGALSDILSLSCTAGRDGRWVGLRLGSSAHNGEDVYGYGGENEEEEEVDEVLEHLGLVLAKTEEEWTAWEARYERRLNLMRKIGRWTRGVEVEEGMDPLADKRTKTRRGSPLREVAASAGEPEEEDPVEPEEGVDADMEPVPPAALQVAPGTPTPRAKRRVARMSTGGKSPRRARTVLEEPVAASTSGAGKGKVVDVVNNDGAVPDALKSGAPFGFGVVKRASTMSTKGKEKAQDAPKNTKDERKRRTKEAEKQERVEWERARERRLRETREKEVAEARREKEKEREGVADRRKQQDEADEEVHQADDVRQMQIQDVSETSFFPPSFPSSAVMHSTPKPQPLATRPTRPFGLRSNTSQGVPLATSRAEETTATNRNRDRHDSSKGKNKEKDTVAEARPPAVELQAEESSYSLGISMVTSAGLPSQIVFPIPPARTTTTTTQKKKRARPVSPTPPPVVRSERPEKRARNDDDAREALLVEDSADVSFIPPSFPLGGIMTSTPKPPFKPALPGSDKAMVAATRNDTSPPPVAAEESSYSLGISMVTSADLPSQTLVPPQKKRSSLVSPTPSPVVRSERPPEKKSAPKDDDAPPAREPQRESGEDDSDMSFIPPSFPPDGIVTSTPKPPSKSTSSNAVSPTQQRDTTPPPSTTALKPTRSFLLPPTPRSRALQTSGSLPAIPPQQPLSPTANKAHLSNKRPASPSTREDGLKKARTMPAVSESLASPPSSPTRTPTRALLRSPEAMRMMQKRVAEGLVDAHTTLLNVRHVLANPEQMIQQAAAGSDKGRGGADADAGAELALPVTPQRTTRGALPTLTDLLASARKGGKSATSSPASAKKTMARKKATLIVRTPSGERVDVMAVGTVRPRVKAHTKEQGVGVGMGTDGVRKGGSGVIGEAKGAEQEQAEEEESLRDTTEPSTIGTGLENYQQLKAAANASMDIFLDESNADTALPEPSPPATASPPPPPQPPAEPTDPYSDAYHFAEDIVVPTGSKLRTFPGAGGSYPFSSSQGNLDPYADDPYDDPYASAGEHVGISPTKSLSSLAGSDSDSDGAANDSDDGGFGPAYPRPFGSGVHSPGFVFDPRAASTQVPPGLSFGVGTITGGAADLLNAAASRAGSAARGAEGARQPASQESKDSWASMYASSAPAEHASSSAAVPSASADAIDEPSSQYALPEGQPVLSSSSPMQAEQNSSPVQAPPSSSNPLFSFSSQAFGSNLTKHVDMVSRLLDKDVDFAGWLKDPEEIDEPSRGVEESP